MFERRAFLWSLAGFIICIIPLFGLIFQDFGGGSPTLTLTDAWAIGIICHIIGASIFALSNSSMSRKLAYLLIPVPLGFLLTFFWTVSFYSFWGTMCY